MNQQDKTNRNNKSIKSKRPRSKKVFAKADHIVHERLVISRVSANPLEGRAIIADYDADEDFCTIFIAHQSAFGIRRQLAENIFKEPESKFRGFGSNSGVLAESSIAHLAPGAAAPMAAHFQMYSVFQT